MLGIDDEATRIVHHALARRFGRVDVLIEARRSRAAIARARLRRLGLVTIAGQVLFELVAVPWLRWRARSRVDDIKRRAQLVDTPLPAHAKRVDSVNSEAARAWLRTIRPSIVVVSGTRIIDAQTLRCIEAPFLNMHAGWTPTYRGVHGGYWALAQRDRARAATTIHRVDEGIDTGPVLARVPLAIDARDQFATYPYLHLEAGVPALLEATEAALEGKLPEGERTPPEPGGLRTHPTLWGYLWRRSKMGVR